MTGARHTFERGYQLLDAAHSGFNEGRAGALEELAHQLREYRPELARAAVAGICAHPLPPPLSSRETPRVAVFAPVL